MSLPEISIKRPIALSCLIITMVVIGISSFFKIGIDLVPKTDIPYVQISTIYPGATPEEIEVEVARRIEDAIASLDGLKHTTSVCMENICAMSLEFHLGVDINLALHNVREKINMIMEDFPDEVETPILDKFDINALPVVILYLTGDRTIDELYDYVDDKLSDRFASIPGVSAVRVHGGNEMQLHVLLSQDKLTESGLTVGEIIQRISANNRKMPAGHVKEGNQEYSITYDAEFRDINALKELEIGNHAGSRIYLGDVATIELRSKEIRQEAYLNDKPGICMEVVKKGEANAVETIKRIRKRFDEINENHQLPGGMELHWHKDTGEFIETAVADAWTSVGLGILLTAALLFLFLHEIRATFIVSITMPVSVIVSFMLMKAMDYTIDLVTLMSIGSSVGVLVANSIVVIENIYKQLSLGQDRKSAAAKGAGGVVNAVAASALTNVVVFVPMMLMTSVVGMILAPFAGVMVIATLMSLFISFTLTPILASLLLTEKTLNRSPRNIRMFRLWDKGYDKLCDLFNRSIRYTSRAPGSVLLIIGIVCGLIAFLIVPRVSMSFFPDTDRSEFSVNLEFPSNTNLDQTRVRAIEIMEAIRKLSFVKETGMTIGYVKALPGQVSQGVHLAQISVVAHPKGTRPSLEEIMNMTRDELNKFHDMIYSMTVPEATGDSSVDMVAYISGTDMNALEQYNRRGIEALQKSGMATDVDSSIRVGKPQITFTPQRPILRNLGIDAVPLGSTIVGSFEGIEAGTYKVDSRSFSIRVKLDNTNGLETVRKLNAGMLNGKPINMDVLTEQKRDNVSVSLIRRDKERASWFYANANSGYVVGDLSRVLEESVNPILPAGYELKFAGLSEMMKEGAADFGEVFLLAIIMTYLVIAAIMESWTRPFLVLFTIPLGFLGMFTAIWLAGLSLSMLGMLGGVMMIGIVVNNAILLMDECATLTQNGMSKHQAMLEASRNKFRPIVMTSIAAVIGMMPMAFGTGTGAELRSSCGVALVGGLVFSSILTVYLIPALYFKFVKDKK
ncbi:MAG: efflux RND transporter permease subunit [Verrucomicrobia bacterium]|nr:efflux RND transporter permease subunit [Verrucomicrobiota bacterium]